MIGKLPLQLAVAAVVLAGCGVSGGSGSGGGGDTTSGGAPCLTPGRVPLAIAIGAHANIPAPSLSTALGQVLSDTAKAGQKITLVRLDGQPTIVFGSAFASDAGNGAARDDDLNSYLDGVQQALAGSVHAKAPETDVLTAFTLAARAAGPGGNVVLLDSGLQTMPPLNFRQPGLVDADPKDVVDFLRRNHELPDLSGRHVLFSGLGSAAIPQPVLDTRLRDNVTNIWSAIATASRASCVGVEDSPNTSAPLSGVPAVSEVALPPPPVTTFTPCGTTELGDRDKVGFIRGTATFRDPAGARSTLQKLADTVKPGRQRVALTGTTSSEGGDAYNRRLSKQRAAAVRQVLIDMGVPASRITAQGVGSHDRGHVEDIGTHGELLPGPAERNRKVIVTLTCPSG